MDLYVNLMKCGQELAWGIGFIRIELNTHRYQILGNMSYRAMKLSIFKKVFSLIFCKF